MGTSQPEPPTRTAVLAVQQLLNQKRIPEGRELMNQLAAQHPSHPDLQIAKLKLALGQDRAEGLKLLLDYRKKFPRDLRFPISELAGEPDKAKYTDKLLALLIEIEGLEPKNRAVFLTDFILVIKRGLAKFPVEVEALRKASELFPSSPELSLIYAQALTNVGRVIEASDIYSSLRERLQKASDFDELRKQIGPGFLAAWEEGLKGR